MLSLVLAEPNIIHLAYREGGNGLTLHVLTRVGAVGRSDGADDHFNAAPPRTLFHLPGLLASPASPCLSHPLLKSRFFCLCLQHHEQQSTGGRWKALLGAGESSVVLFPCLSTGFRGAGLGFDGRAPCVLPAPVPALLPLGSGCSHTSVAGILWASSASARRRSGACAERAGAFSRPSLCSTPS